MDLIVVKDVSGRILKANLAYAYAVQRNLEELIGSTLTGIDAFDGEIIESPTIQSVDLPGLFKVSRYAIFGNDDQGEEVIILRDLLSEKGARTLTELAPPRPGKHAFSIDDVIDEVLDWMAYEFSRARIQIDRHRSTEAIVNVDQGQFIQVFTNLFTNAVDAMAGGGTLTIATHRIAGGSEEQVRIQISDTGAGIPLEQLHKIFTPYSTSKPTGKGTGHGLSVAKSIVMAHGGRLAVENVPGMGTTFQIDIPASEIDSMISAVNS